MPDTVLGSFHAQISVNLHQPYSEAYIMIPTLKNEATGAQ